MSNSLILYQSDILLHGRNPSNFRKMENATHELQGDSPICGDHMTLYLKVDNNRIEDIAFDSDACCAVCKASSSMMTEAIKHKSITDADTLARLFLNMVDDQVLTPADRKRLNKLTVFGRIVEVPSRIECAILSWTTLLYAIKVIHDDSKSNIAIEERYKHSLKVTAL
ncbi:Fe-S cluster assembly sulfur transfer protein SufU [Pleionea mediterranea]|uniref:Nitrogen fixation NifU-like protein n=1 Tax=Pleionea mediterranea TaxID=523701 RepID=A0A316FZ71_9GAMM|nr:SUF system NifU family Fe-S cluster assembly protein [Pleionea mediterranea]PWK53869.1 nitrogen fixation NifU-like protein [Pleionea mediterranea]